METELQEEIGSRFPMRKSGFKEGCYDVTTVNLQGCAYRFYTVQTR